MNRRKAPQLSELDTYVFIDASNIRSCCLKTLGWRPDFIKLKEYFADKYAKLKEVRYYEGIANGDLDKRSEFKKFRKAGYTVCPLERKEYTDEIELKGKIICKRCEARQCTKLTKKVKKLKSNVDVYLATELLRVAFSSKRPVHIILVSCDGDYAEMIKTALDENERVYISVIATPVVRSARNTCSTRLQKIRGYSDRFHLTDIRDIEKYIKQQK